MPAFLTPSAALAAKIELHTALGEAERAALATLVIRPQAVRAGETLAAVGDPLDVATIVLSGMLCRCKALPDGRRQILSVLLPGDLVDAEAGVLRRRDDALEAVGEAIVAVIPQSRLTAVGAQYPRLREAFLREALIEAAVAREWVRNLGRRLAKEALAHLICEIHLRMEAVGLAPQNRLAFPLKQQHLADALGLSMIHLNRVYRQLRETGLIKVEQRWLHMPDPQALRALAHFEADYLHFVRAAA